MIRLPLRSVSRRFPFRRRSLSIWLLVLLYLIVLLTPRSVLFQIKLIFMPNSSVFPISTHPNQPLGQQKTIKLEDESLCSTTWIHGKTFQFVAFAVNDFSEVNFMMPGEFSGINIENYKCLFQQNTSEIATPVTKLGGPTALDASRRTLHLRCEIPEEIAENTAVSTKMTLGKSAFEKFHYLTFLTFKILERRNATKFVFVEIIKYFLMLNIMII